MQYGFVIPYKLFFFLWCFIFFNEFLYTMPDCPFRNLLFFSLINKPAQAIACSASQDFCISNFCLIYKHTAQDNQITHFNHLTDLFLAPLFFALFSLENHF